MASKVRAMLALTAQFPALQVRIFSGLVEENVRRVVVRPETAVGTVVSQQI
jgi:isopentenyl phosphate kinase